MAKISRQDDNNPALPINMVVVFFRVGKEYAPDKNAHDEEESVASADIAGRETVKRPDQDLVGKEPLLSVRMRADRLIQIPKTALMAIQAGANPATRGALRMAQ